LLYQQLADGDLEEVSIPAPWTKIGEVELIVLRDAPIEICNTAYGRFQEQKKRDVERAYQKTSSSEKEILRKRWQRLKRRMREATKNPRRLPLPPYR
jgi:hypothetical protein